MKFSFSLYNVLKGEHAIFNIVQVSVFITLEANECVKELIYS